MQKMLATRFILFLVVMAVVSSVSYAADPDPLRDFCVGLDDDDSNSTVFVNGKLCKNPDLATPEDFFYTGLDQGGNTTNPLGSNLSRVFDDELKGLNHQGVSMVRIDMAPEGINPPHSHPRASEILFVSKGTMYVGFIESNPYDATVPNKLYAKILYPGDVFMFPRGTIHFQYNIGKTNALAHASFNSQNPGVVTVASSVFGCVPPINPKLLAKAFQMDVKSVQHLQSLRWIRNT